MDHNIEIDFVKNYIRKQYQDRLIFELSSKKLREKALSRFSHSSETMLSPRFEQCDMQEICKFISIHNIMNQQCYIISFDKNDGKTLALSDAYECCKNSYMAMILISKNFVVVKEECEGKSLTFLAK